MVASVTDRERSAMSDDGGRTRRLDRLVVASASGAAMVLVGIATTKGPGMSPDSVVYMATGVNLSDSHRLVNVADKALTLFPPGMPFVAAAGEKAGLGVYVTLWLVSIASFGAIVLLGHHLLRRTVTNRSVLYGATALLAVSQALFGVSKMAWSEPPFIVVTLAFLLLLGRTCERRAAGVLDLSALAVLCWIAFLLRYAGGALIATGFVALVIALRPLDRAAIARIAGFGALATSVPMAWMLRNHATDGTFLGPRTPSPDNFWDVLVRTFGVFGEWLVPENSLAIGLLALVGVAAVALVALALRAIRTPDLTAPVAEHAQLWCCLLFTVVYVAYLTYASVSTAFTPTDSRYLSPVYVPLVAIVAASASALIARAADRRLRLVVATVLVAVIGGQLLTTVRDTRDGARSGIGLNADVVVDSELARSTAQLVSSTSGELVLYSNNPNALWSATRIQPIHFAPRDVGVRGRPVGGELDQFVRQVNCTTAPVYLVVYIVSDGRYIDLKEIRTALDVRRVGGGIDGSLFRVTAREPASCSSEAASTVRHRSPDA